MRQLQPRRKNYLGLVGWVWGGNYKIERYLYTLHRITGLGILLFGVIHLCVTTFFRIQGQDVWESAMTLLHNPWFKFGEFLVVLAFAYHSLNGLRLIIQELGFGMGKPTPPVYPYRDSLRKNRSWTMTLVGIAALIALLFLYDFLIGGW
jgi:succinate dehydrogenase / fumarate reductase cytochrome b subunit